MAPAPEVETEEEAEERQRNYEQQRKEYEQEQERRAEERKQQFEREQKEHEAERARREKLYKARVSKFDRILDKAPAMFSAAQLTFEPQSIQGELIFVDTAEQFYASDRDSGRFEGLEAKHGTSSGFDAAVILLDQVVQIL